MLSKGLSQVYASLHGNITMDKVANLLITLKNAGYAHKDYATVPFSRYALSIVRALLDQGYIAGYDRKNRSKGGDLIHIDLKYKDQVQKNSPAITDVKRISKSSTRVYRGTDKLYKFRQGYGHIFLSTPKGILTSKQAYDAHVGGEVLFSIW